jgi:type II secretory pathway component PulK
MKRSSPAGFATVMAMVSLMLIGVTIAGLMTRISMQARRTQSELRRAQQEQISIARSLVGSEMKLPVDFNANLDRR